MKLGEFDVEFDLNLVRFNLMREYEIKILELVDDI